MYIVVEENVYNTILSEYGEDYVLIDGGDFCVYITGLIEAGYAEEIDGEFYTISLRPSQKGMFIGSF